MYTAIYILAFFLVIFNFKRTLKFWPIFALLNRWILLLFFTLLGWSLFDTLGWSKPNILVFIICFLGFLFLIGMILSWFRIKNNNYSSLLPNSSPISPQKSWPIDFFFIRNKGEIEKAGFYRVENVAMDINNNEFARVIVFQNKSKTVQLKYIFLIRFGHIFSLAYSFLSETSSGYYITENVPIPFFGSYPKSWSVKKHLLCHSWKILYRLHKKHLAQKKQRALRIKKAPLDQLKEQKRILLAYNYDKGFINNYHLWGDEGFLTEKGCYTLWLNTFLCNYFGISLIKDQ